MWTELLMRSPAGFKPTGGAGEEGRNIWISLHQNGVALFGSIPAADRTSHLITHLAIDRLDIKLVFLAAIALHFEFDHTSSGLVGSPDAE